MIEQLQQLEAEVQAAVQTVQSEQELLDYRNTILGKSGKITHFLK